MCVGNFANNARLMICRRICRGISLIERNKSNKHQHHHQQQCNLFLLSQYKPWPIYFTYFAQILTAREKKHIHTQMLCLFLFAICFFMTYFLQTNPGALIIKMILLAAGQYFYFHATQPINQSIKWPGKLATLAKLNWVRYSLIGRTHLKNRTSTALRAMLNHCPTKNLHKKKIYI